MLFIAVILMNTFTCITLHFVLIVNHLHFFFNILFFVTYTQLIHTDDDDFPPKILTW